MRRHLGAISVVCAIAATISGGCGSFGSDAAAADYSLPDTLRVVTLYSPTSFFMYRDSEMGYDYSLVRSLAKDKGIELKLEVSPSLADAMARLDSGYVDLVAYEVPITSEYTDRAIACGPVSTTHQVLVQPRRSDSLITDVTHLVGRDIYVEDGSKYQQRINNLNSELGGGIRIHTVNRDTLITEDLIDMVSRGEIPLTVVDSDIARINKTYYPDLDITLEVSFAQRAAWAVNPGRQWLADSINHWFESSRLIEANDMLLKRYFELSKQLPGQPSIDLSKGHVSAYDSSFKREGAKIDLDWRILAAQGFIESRFDNNVKSWSGAKGLMQIMPGTARAYKVDPATLVIPDVSIELAGRIMGELDKAFVARVPDPVERRYFAIAAYNSGLGHIYDAIALAAKTGRDPTRWFGNVEDALLLKANPEYYNDPVCRFGYYRGRQTVQYVHEVMEFYDKILAAGIK